MATRSPRSSRTDSRTRRHTEETERELRDIQRQLQELAERAPAIVYTVPDSVVFTVDPETVPDNLTTQVLVPVINTLVQQFDELRRAYINTIQGLIRSGLGEGNRNS